MVDMGNAQTSPEWRPPSRHDPRSAVAAGRRLKGQTQAQLATELNRHPLADEEWTATKVGKLEQGRKEFTVETLMAISDVQQLPYAFYLVGPDAPASRYAGLAQSNVLPFRKRRAARPIEKEQIPA